MMGSAPVVDRLLDAECVSFLEPETQSFEGETESDFEPIWLASSLGDFFFSPELVFLERVSHENQCLFGCFPGVLHLRGPPSV
jgi:hypothetical protein